MKTIALLQIITGIGLFAFGFQKAVFREYSLMRRYREGKCGEKTAKISGILQLIFGVLNISLSVSLFVFEISILGVISSAALVITAVIFAVMSRLDF